MPPAPIVAPSTDATPAPGDAAHGPITGGASAGTAFTGPAALPPLPQTRMGKLGRHLRNGTLTERLLEPLGVLSTHSSVRWRGARSESEGIQALARWGELFLADLPDGSWVLSLGEGEGFHRALNDELHGRSVRTRSRALDEVLRWTPDDARGLGGILCGHIDVARITTAARALARHPVLGNVRFEYAAGINPEHAQFRKQDEYADTWFVAPGLLDSPNPYQIYAESLERFEQKCGLRDYLDLYQVLTHVVRSGVRGDIAEFGSYRGHSGWLIAKTLQALGSDKRVWLFDMFEEFPEENLGVDHIWNHSHKVDFAEVQSKFTDLPRVTLVKGDFTKTLPSANLGALALVYVDCDSYRGTRYLVQQLWDGLAPGAALVSEDYGHPALLCSRAAMHEEFDGKPGCFRWFSQFSGLYVVLKLA